MSYSTVSEYQSAFMREIEAKNLDLQVVNDDSFPLEQVYKDSFWTGYYTSRPGMKLAIRNYGSYSYMSNTIYALDRFGYKYDDATSQLHRLLIETN